ncbi:MAG TPA: lipoprotein signal peptidase [Chitinophagaceae bacterium]|nr:lipoprotein signal peptidase [Chitinophagaceae bacterium]
MKLKHVLLTVGVVLLLDQALKIYIKTHFFYGQEVNVIGSWFRLHFIENEGMAFGMKFGEHWGKIFLTLFRLIAVIWGFYFIQTTLIKQKFANGLIFCSALILAGAMGNLIDSLFYGKIFTESSFHMAKMVAWGQGYGDLLHGKVVDMLYFPVMSGNLPSWFPVWAGQPYEFFRPVFNLADFSISFGVITILVFQNKLLHKKTNSTDEKSIDKEIVFEEVKSETIEIEKQSETY